MAKSNVRGKLPLPMGKPIQVIKPSPAERAVLEKVGWNDGDPVPPDLAKVIAEMQAEAEHLPPPVPLTTKPLELPTPVALDTLPLEKQAEYKNLLEQMLGGAKTEAAKAEQQRRKQAELLLPEAGPGINEAITVSSSEEDAPGWPVVDDRKKEAQEAEETGEEASEPEKEPEDKADFEMKFCPHCGWAVAQKDLAVVTDDDKMRYLEAALSGQPFRKQYQFYGGRMSLSFRTLLPSETDLIYKQIRDDIEAKVITRIPEERDIRLRYYTLMMLEEVVLGSNVYSLAPMRHLPLNRQLETLLTGVLKSEMLLRHAVLTAGEFRDLADKLEVNAINPDFWKAADTSN